MNAILVLTTAALAATTSTAATTDDLQLQFVTFVHRHGDRSPVGAYINDPYGNESLWNNGWGELTTAGKRNAYNLGKWLRQRYDHFLPKTYSKRDYEVQSTDMSRTLMSAYLLLTALYEPTGTDVWNPEIKWQPIPVHTTPLALDNVLASNKPCPKHAHLQRQLMLSEEFTSQIRPHADALAQISRHAGYNTSDTLTDFLAATIIYDSLKVQHENGFRLPDWTRPYFPQPLQNLSSLALRLSTYNAPMKRLSCGLLVNDILQHFNAKQRGLLDKKIWHYSAHDVTIVGLRQCLGFDDADSPPYASALILELSARKQTHFVRILYKAGDSLRAMVMPGCTELCPLDRFETLVAPVIPEDWEAECRI